MDENENDALAAKCQGYLRVLCEEVGNRSVGTVGNRRATQFFMQEIAALGWSTESQAFEALDWEEQGASLHVGGAEFQVLASPFAPGCDVEAVLVSAATVEDLDGLDARGKIILLHGEIAKEQLMPKNFVFYNPEEHQRIVAALENSGAAALVCAAGRNAGLAGGAYPCPLIEDGDFDVPSVYMTEEEGGRLLPSVGKAARLRSACRRIRSGGENIVARKGRDGAERIVVTAHIDAKKGTPGAIDNATGVIILLLVADLLRDYGGSRQVEIVALNGEDYYAVSGQMRFLAENEGRFDTMWLNINIDGAGYVLGDTAFSYYGVPERVKANAERVLRDCQGIREGNQWVQGDHSMFVQYGRPAIAVSSAWFTENIDDQNITHTVKDNPGIVDCGKVVDAARAIAALIKAL